jgi:hypothetical protein
MGEKGGRRRREGSEEEGRNTEESKSCLCSRYSRGRGRDAWEFRDHLCCILRSHPPQKRRKEQNSMEWYRPGTCPFP